MFTKISVRIQDTCFLLDCGRMNLGPFAALHYSILVVVVVVSRLLLTNDTLVSKVQQQILMYLTLG